MQEIEFRAWNGEKMLYNFGMTSKGESGEYGQTSGGDYWDIKLYDIGIKQIMQYIGIKDIHQKKVFQGDIVKVKRFIFKDCRRKEVEGMEEYIGEVVWHQFGWHIAEKIKDGIRYHSLWLWNVKDDETDPDTHFMEILGNRWDNPEMKVIE